MARALTAAVLLLTVASTTAHAEDNPSIPDDVQAVADDIGIDPIDLAGAVNTTGLEPKQYLCKVEGIACPKVTPLNYPAYIAANSKYGQRAVCVSRIETGSWTAFYNPIPVGREHAQSFFGWLPSTFYSVSAGPLGNLDVEIRAFDRMLDLGRGNEFFGILHKLC